MMAQVLPRTSAAPSDGHIPSLDGMRAISVLVVFAAHCGLERFIPGGFGVTVFFFLSGYLITTLLCKEFAAHGRIDVGAFYARRACRILPPFYLVLAFGFLLRALNVVDTKLSLPAVLSQLFHYSNFYIASNGYGGTVPGTAVYWSLAVEEHFYLVFPVLFVVLATRRWTLQRIAGVLGALAALVLVWRMVLVFGLHASLNRTYLASDTRVDSILFGCILATFANPISTGWGTDVSVVVRRWMHRLRVPALVVVAVTLVVRNDAFRETARYTIQGLAFIPIFFVAISEPTRDVHRFLNAPLVRRIGRLSYSLYLVHHVVIYTLDHRAELGGINVDSVAYQAVRGVVALAIALGLAEVLHRMVERPFARVGRRVTAKRLAGRQPLPTAVSRQLRAQQRADELMMAAGGWRASEPVSHLQ
jgi:peptidoglycan/LPS O-acetylase OafA/YrhL